MILLTLWICLPPIYSSSSSFLLCPLTNTKCWTAFVTSLFLQGVILKKTRDQTKQKDTMSDRFDCHNCNESLYGRKYIQVEDNPHCIPCYDRLHAHTCQECKEIISHNAKVWNQPSARNLKYFFFFLFNCILLIVINCLFNNYNVQYIYCARLSMSLFSQTIINNMRAEQAYKKTSKYSIINSWYQRK